MLYLASTAFLVSLLASVARADVVDVQGASQRPKKGRENHAGTDSLAALIVDNDLFAFCDEYVRVPLEKRA
jgi:hypothetical protein